jgi:Der1-like family protein
MNFREFKTWFGQQPFVTKYITVLSVLIPTLLRLNPPLIYSLVFTPEIWRRAQIWRLFSHFFASFLSVPFVMSLLLRVRYSYQLERIMGSVKYAYFISFVMVLLNLVNLYTRLPMMWDALSMCITYLWSKQYANAVVSFFGGFYIPGRYLPAVLILWDGLLKQRWMENVIGCLIAHVYWFGEEEGWLRIPRWMSIGIEEMQGTRRDGYKRVDHSSRMDMTDSTVTQGHKVFFGKSYTLGE